MNKIEKLIYDKVKNSPTIKFALRNAYQMFFDMLPAPANESVAPIETKENCFFGFHDCSPFSQEEDKLLAHHTTIPLRMPKTGEAVEVGYFDLTHEGKMGEFHVLGKSTAWNYHKGCRLQWCGKDYIVYNTCQDGCPVAVIADMFGKVCRQLPRAIDAVSPDGEYATSFSYERLNILMPGYGYENMTDGACLDENAPADTGLYLMNTTTGETELVASLKQLCESVPGDDASLYSHFVTHTEFSHDGRYVSFLHRWIGTDYRRRFSRIGIWDRQTQELTFLPTTGMVSHYVWNSKHQLVAYCSIKEGDAHVLFDVEKGGYKPLCLGRLNVDGHQSMIDDDVFVTDTYPDRQRMASLHLVNIRNNTYERVAYLFSPKQFQTKDFRQHIACDLHPRVSPSGRFVCFDSVYTGERSLCVMPLPDR